jgi:hypothetical protein
MSRMVDWNDFSREIPERFRLLTIDAYSFSIEFVQFAPDPDTVTAIANNIISAAANVIMPHPHCSISALHRQETSQALFAVAFGHPVYDFQIQFHDNQLVIVKQNCSLEELVLTMPLIEGVANQLFGTDSVTSIKNAAFMRWAHRTSHVFDFQLQVGRRISDETVACTNRDVSKWFLNLREDDDSVTGLVAPDEMYRSDALMSFRKDWFGRTRTLWVDYKAPWNVTQRDINLQVSLRVGEAPGDAGPDDSELKNFGWVLPGFYRDFVLARLFAEIFRDINVVARP